jgi:hypothetical protein
MIHYGPAQSESDLIGIRDLQRLNLPSQLTHEELQREGFVTVVHSLEDLKKLHDIEPGIIAKETHQVVGYLLAMTEASKKDIPVLIPMFDIFDQVDYLGKLVSNYHYLVVGQVCVDKNYRGTGLIDEMYKAYQLHFQNKYDFAITEIATLNPRSIRAHLRVGFEIVHTYVDPDNVEWCIVLMDWR